jgi:hypothetical protein
MAHPYTPVRTEDGLLQGEATEDVPLGHSGDVSPMEETAPSPLRQPSVAPHEEIREKLPSTAAGSTPESLKSQYLCRLYILLLELRSLISLL